MALAAPNDLQMSRLMSSRVRVSRRIEVYEADQTTLWRGSEAWGPIDGSVNVDASRNERRTLSLSVVPLDPTIHLGVDGFWYDKVIRVFWGFYDTLAEDDSLWEVPLGDFMIDTIEDDYFPTTIKLGGRDLMKKLLVSKFQRTISFPAGTNVALIVASLAGNAGITNIITPWSASFLAPGLPLNQTFDADTTRFDALEKILTALGYEIYMDAYSNLVVRLFQDPATLGPVLTFGTGQDGNMTKIARKMNDAELYNHVVVRGSAEANKTVFAEVRITDPTSPVHEDKIGDRLYSFPTEVIDNNYDALQLARQFLQVKSLESYEVDFGSITAAWLEGGDVVGYDDPEPLKNEPDNYFLSNFDIPLGLGDMNGTFKRVVVATSD